MAPENVRSTVADVRGEISPGIELCGQPDCDRARVFCFGQNRSDACIHPSQRVADLAADRFGVGRGSALRIPDLAGDFSRGVIANVTTAGSVATAVAIATGNTLEAVIGGFLIHWWSSGRDTFTTPYAIAKFTAICVVVTTPISAAIGVGSLALAGFADWDKIPRIGFTWWMGDVTGALVVTPAIVLWAMSNVRDFSRDELLKSAAVMVTAIAVGVIAFSPLFEQTAVRDSLASSRSFRCCGPHCDVAPVIPRRSS